LKILTITYGFPSEQEPYHGIFVLRQMQALMALGHEFRVLRVIPYRPWWVRPWNKKRPVSRSDRYEYDGVKVRIVGGLAPPRLYGLDLLRRQMNAAIEEEVRAFRPDLIHAHRVLSAGYLAIDRNRPVVVTAHGGDAYATPYRRAGLRRAARRVLSRADELVAVSQFIQNHLIRLGAERSTVVYNGADEQRFYPRAREASRRRFGIDPDRFVVSFAGNVVTAKGTNELAAALVRLADLRPFALVAGTGANQRPMSDALRAGCIEARFLGAVDHDTLADVYGAADAVALPSYFEGFPAVVCETMLSGRTIVTTPVGGIPEIVAHGSNGILVSPRDARALAESLRQIFASPDFKRHIERRARNDAHERLTWSANARAYQTIYTRAAAHA
jgi:teichuronic acid biosynthesis glycosyltransferase TuaC